VTAEKCSFSLIWKRIPDSWSSDRECQNQDRGKFDENENGALLQAGKC